mgnify:CR=1 FL=1
MKGGWVKLYRELLDKPIWQLSTPNQRSVLIAILLLANHSENKWEWKGESYKVKPGQFITSMDNLAKKSGKGITRQVVRGAMQRFIKFDFITIETTKANTLINVVNWASYQSEKLETTNDSTIGQPSDNQRTTTNKNVKNNKNTSTRKKREYDENSSSFKLAKYLYLKIQENDPNAKEPNFQTWADDARKLMELDKRSKENIYNVINWCQQDEFWSSNILSVKKLRSQFTQLFIKMNKDTEWLMRNTKQVSAGHEATDMNDLDRQQEENLRRAEEKYRKEHPELNE